MEFGLLDGLVNALSSADKEVVAQLEKIGLDPYPGRPGQLGSDVEQEMKAFDKLLKR